MTDYVHGYGDDEAARLRDQASVLAGLLHDDTRYPAGAQILEAGCGVGAQTVELVRRSPRASFVAIDRSAESLASAQLAVAARIGRRAAVRFTQADIDALPFEDGGFDHVFVCFVLEHLPDPVGSLRKLRRVLRPGGTITVIEGDHGSVLMYPDSAAARRAIDCQVRLQRAAGGDACIGRRLYALLAAAGFEGPSVSPRIAYADGGLPLWVEGFTRRTFTAMVAATRPAALEAGLISAAEFDAGIADLGRAAEPDGMLSYTFFKAVATR